MGLDMFLQVLRTLKGLATKVTLVRLQRNMDPDMRGDVVTLDDSSSATAPFASQVEIVGALTANMALTHMFLIRSSVWVFTPPRQKVMEGRKPT